MLENEQFKTFWGHAEELRRAFFKILLVIGIAFLLSLTFYDFLFSILTKPLQPIGFSKYKISTERIFNPSSASIIYRLPAETGIINVRGEGTHQVDAFHYKIEPGYFLEYESEVLESNLLILSPLEGLSVAFKVCFWMSLALTSPVWGAILLQFALPGLKKNEKNLLVPFACLSFLWIGGGLFFAYFITIPLANQYLRLFNGSLGVNWWSLSHYMDYTAILFLGHAIAFELSLILFFLVHFGILPYVWLSQKRRYMIVLSFFLGAILTPPDILTQILLASAFIIIYEAAILYAFLRARHFDAHRIKDEISNHI